MTVKTKLELFMKEFKLNQKEGEEMLDQRQADVLNLITREIQEKQLSQKEVDEIMEHVEQLFYTDGILRR